MIPQGALFDSKPSPSPRRAWIEIGSPTDRGRCAEVALPTEGVD